MDLHDKKRHDVRFVKACCDRDTLLYVPFIGPQCSFIYSAVILAPPEYRMIEHQEIGGYPWALEALNSLRVRRTGSNNGLPCPLLAQSSLSETSARLSAFGGEADIHGRFA